MREASIEKAACFKQIEKQDFWHTGTRKGHPKTMGMTSNNATQKWNKDHYSQVKVSVDKSLASEFRAACTKNNVSQASVIKNMMEGYCSRASKSKISTRGFRRKQTAAAISLLEMIRDEEAAYMDRIPENMQGGEKHETAEECVSRLNEAIDALAEAYFL